MKRGGWLRRGAGLRKKSRSRLGLDTLEQDEMESLAKACVMVRAGAFYEINARSLDLSWSGPCEDGCGRSGPLQFSHIFGRGEAPRLVWVPENAMAQHPGCHKRWTERPWDRDVMLDVVLRGRVPCEFAPDPQRYWTRLRSLKEMKGKVDHAMQRVANTRLLTMIGKHALEDLEWCFEQRRLKAARRLESQGGIVGPGTLNGSGKAARARFRKESE